MSVTVLFTLFASSLALRICHHNDFHARYVEVDRFDSICKAEDVAEGNCFGSAARVKAAMDAAQCDVRVFAGDWMQGTVYDTVFENEIAIDTINAIGYDLATFGNHEFNKGPQPLYETVMKTPNTTWFSSNVYFTAAPEGFKTFRQRQFADICWIGALTPCTKEISSPGQDVFIGKPDRAMRRALSKCDQTDNVVAVTHVGYEQDIELCKSVLEIDLIIGGHSHSNLAQGLYPTRVEREDGSVCWVVQAFAYGRYLGVLDISFDEGVLEFDGEAYVPLDSRVKMDRSVEKMIKKYTEQVDESIQEVIGVTTATIDGGSQCRAVECQMGNLVCDALLAFAGPKQEAQACIMNGGNIRASIGKGDITIEEILTTLPFGEVHAVITLPGSGLKEALENGFLAVSDPEIKGRFPQVGGMVVDVDYSAPAGSRVKKIVIAGEELKMDQLYTIVTNTFLATGGDGYKWTGATEIELSGRGTDVLTLEYLVANNPYTPFTEGRINNIAA